MNEFTRVGMLLRKNMKRNILISCMFFVCVWPVSGFEGIPVSRTELSSVDFVVAVVEAVYPDLTSMDCEDIIELFVVWEKEYTSMRWSGGEISFTGDWRERIPVILDQAGSFISLQFDRLHPCLRMDHDELRIVSCVGCPDGQCGSVEFPYARCICLVLLIPS